MSDEGILEKNLADVLDRVRDVRIDEHDWPWLALERTLALSRSSAPFAQGTRVC